MKVALVLADGTCFKGESFGSFKKKTGEVVFNTTMGGYGEIITDPASSGQIVVMTYPLIGNYGVNKEGLQSERIHASGLVMKEATTQPSNWLLQDTLENFLNRNEVPAITGLDTRSLTRYIRREGSMPGIIVPEEEADPQWFENYDATCQDFTGEVTIEGVATFGEGDNHLVVVDLGLGKGLLEALINHNCRLTVVPAGTSAEEILSYDPQGLVLSSGPEGGLGLEELAWDLKTAIKRLPTMGIGVGMEVIAMAFGACLKKMKFGHRGANYPVKDLFKDKISITQQNHGYVVEEESLGKTGLIVAQENIHDGTVEGLRHKELPVLALQYYPIPVASLEGEETFYSQFNNML